MLLADLTIDGAQRRVVMTVPRDGTFYVLDARSGALVSKKAIDGRPAAEEAQGLTATGWTFAMHRTPDAVAGKDRALCRRTTR